MDTAKIFANGGSQAVRLPKSCRFDQEEIFVQKIGNIVMLIPKDDPWASAILGMSMFTEDFLAAAPEDLPLQERPEK